MIVDAKINDLNEIGNGVLTKGAIQVDVTVNVDSEDFYIEFQTSNTLDVNVVSSVLGAYDGTSSYHDFKSKVSKFKEYENDWDFEDLVKEIVKNANVRKRLLINGTCQ